MQTHSVHPAAGAIGDDYVAMELRVKGMNIAIVAAHLNPVKQPADTARNLQKMSRVLELNQEIGTPIIVGGDFNVEPEELASGSLWLDQLGVDLVLLAVA